MKTQTWIFTICTMLILANLAYAENQVQVIYSNQIRKPDLVVHSFAPPEGHIRVGTETKLNIEVFNNSQIDVAIPFVVKAWSDSAPLPITAVINYLRGGDKVSIRLPWVPQDFGLKEVIVAVDANNEIDELSEGNNAVLRRINVLPNTNQITVSSSPTETLRQSIYRPMSSGVNNAATSINATTAHSVEQNAVQPSTPPTSAAQRHIAIEQRDYDLLRRSHGGGLPRKIIQLPDGNALEISQGQVIRYALQGETTKLAVSYYMSNDKPIIGNIISIAGANHEVLASIAPREHLVSEGIPPFAQRGDEGGYAFDVRSAGDYTITVSVAGSEATIPQRIIEVPVRKGASREEVARQLGTPDSMSDWYTQWYESSNYRGHENENWYYNAYPYMQLYFKSGRLERVSVEHRDAATLNQMNSISGTGSVSW